MLTNVYTQKYIYFMYIFFLFGFIFMRYAKWPHYPPRHINHISPKISQYFIY